MFVSGMMRYSTLLAFCIAPSFCLQTDYLTDSNTCNTTLSTSTGGFLETSTSLLYSGSTACSVKLSVSWGIRIFLTFTRFDLEPPTNGICDDYLTIYDGATRSASTWSYGQLCDYVIADLNMTSSGSEVLLDFVTDAHANYHGFAVLYSAVSSNYPCQSGEHECSSQGICISEDLKCDGYEQCADATDEVNCPDSGSASSEKKTQIIIVVVVVIGGLLLAVVGVIVGRMLYQRYTMKKLLRDVDLDGEEKVYREYPITEKYENDAYL